MPPDLCYVYNFGHARRSLPLLLPTDRGLQLKQDFDAFIDELKTAIPKAFESEEYTKHRDKVMQELEMGRRQIIVQVEQRTARAGFLKGPARNGRSPRACATQREARWAIDLGTHAGVPSSHLSSVIGRWFEPSAFITNSSAYG